MYVAESSQSRGGMTEVNSRFSGIDVIELLEHWMFGSPEHPMLEEFYYINSTEPTVHFRHSTSALTGFCDVHVTSQKMEAGTLDDRLPNANVGRLPARLLLP